jgi:hypothetical protein
LGGSFGSAVSLIDEQEHTQMPGDISSPATSASRGVESILDRAWLDLYKETCTNIRTTDDISFKLLGFVPTFAGSAAGALALLEKSQFLAAAAPGSVLALSILGLGVTFGLFRWELRNIQKCAWLVRRAADLEQYALSSGREPLLYIQYLGWTRERRPTLKRPWGKTEAEVVVYCAAMLAWCVPAALAAISLWLRAYQ